MRGVDDSIGKQVSLGIFRENGQSQKFSILKESWPFIESEKTINNDNSFNFFLLLNGQNAKLAINEEVNVAAFYIKEIGTLNNFNDVRIKNVKDPNDENDVATRKHVDNRKQIIEVKSENIILSSGRIIRTGIGGPNHISKVYTIKINGTNITSFRKTNNQENVVTIFQNPF